MLPVSGINLAGSFAITSSASLVQTGSVAITSSAVLGVSGITLAGSFAISNYTNWGGAGSVFIVNANSLAVKTDSHVGPAPNYKQGTGTTSGTFTGVWTPATGSRAMIYGWDISTDAAMLVRVLISGTSTLVLSQYRMPASGTILRNIIPLIISGAVDQKVGIGLGANGNVDATFFGYDAP